MKVGDKKSFSHAEAGGGGGGHTKFLGCFHAEA